jgi:hypothetical protein
MTEPESVLTAGKSALESCRLLSSLAAGRCWAAIREAATRQSLDATHWSNIVEAEMREVGAQLLRKLDAQQLVVSKANHTISELRKRIKAYHQDSGCRKCRLRNTKFNRFDLCDTCAKEPPCPTTQQPTAPDASKSDPSAPNADLPPPSTAA